MSPAPTPRRITPGRGRGRVRMVWVAAAAVLAVALAGCSAAAPLPPQPTTVEVVVREHDFAVDPAPPLPAGRVVFHLRNAGEVAHELAVVDVADDPSPGEGQGSPEVVPTLGVVHARPPGGDGRVAVDVAPGRYALVCLRSDDAGVSHAARGERVDFAVR